MRSFIVIFISIFILSCSTKKEVNLQNIDRYMGKELYIRAFKLENILEVWVKDGSKFKLLRRYPIAKLSGTIGPKLREGDKQVPEGVYIITKRSLKPKSSYHKAIKINFPNSVDRFHQRDGSDIYIHGGDKSIGCIAMGDDIIDEIYTLVKSSFKSSPKVFITIHPFRYEKYLLDLYRGYKDYPFWMELKAIYDYFEKNRTLPNIDTSNGHYEISS
jgi:murein L,D-transpeptidase YafK